MSAENDRTLTVRRVTGHQGKILYRPLDETAEKFCTLLEQKTLTPIDIDRIKHLGFIVLVRVLTESETDEVL